MPCLRQNFLWNLAADWWKAVNDQAFFWLDWQAIKHTFASIAEEVGCTEFTVRSVFTDYVQELEQTICFEILKWMGIDEIHLIKPRGVITNIQNNTVVELLPNRNKKTVIRHLLGLRGKEEISYVAMDMWMPYSFEALRSYFQRAHSKKNLKRPKFDGWQNALIMAFQSLQWALWRLQNRQKKLKKLSVELIYQS